MFDNIIFSGVYSDRFEEAYNTLKMHLKRIVPEENIQYKKVDQALFDVEHEVCLLCPSNVKPPCKFPLHHGEDCKIVNQLEMYEKYLGTDKILIITDCDIHVDPVTVRAKLPGILDKLNTYDMIFQTEYLTGSRQRFTSNINIGLNISRSSENIIELYRKVLAHMRRNKHPYTWEQQVVNWMFSDRKTDVTFTTIPNGDLFQHDLIGGDISKMEFNLNKDPREELIQDILDIGLTGDDRGNIYYDKYAEYVRYVEEGTLQGMWQYPEELADLCIYLASKNIKSFLNIGTFNGHTFNFISDYLNKYNTVRCISIDPIEHTIYNRREEYTYTSETSKDYKEQEFDLVFIDGDHSYRCVMEDYTYVGQFAKFCVFHDIDDDFIRQDSKDGGVPRFWEDKKIDTPDKCIEFIAENKPKNIMGIGVLLRDLEG